MITEGHHYFNNETDFWTVNKNKIFLDIARQEKNILDVGCGKGTFLKDLALLGISCEGIDFSEEMLRGAKKNCEGYPVTLHCGDFSTYSFKKKYDCIVGSGIIEHMEDDTQFIKKMYDLLNPHGKIILLTAAYPWLYSSFDKGVHHYRRYSKKQLHSLLEQNKFTVLSTRYWDVLGIPYLLFARLSKRMLLTEKQLTSSGMNMLLDRWFHFVENKIKPPCGLNLIVVAKK